MSNPKLKLLRSAEDGTGAPLGERRESTGKHVLWGLVTPKGDESCRWQSRDGHWISLAIGHGEEIGSVVVAASDGRRELVPSYEGALLLAKSWRERV